MIWAADIELQPHQMVTVQFLEQAQTSDPGKTIDELYPDEPPCEETDFTPTPEMRTKLLAKLRAMPTYRDSFNLSLDSSQGASVRVQTAPEDHGFTFSVLWTSFQSDERVRMSLHSYTLQSLEYRTTDLHYYVQEGLNYGDEVKFAISA